MTERGVFNTSVDGEALRICMEIQGKANLPEPLRSSVNELYRQRYVLHTISDPIALRLLLDIYADSGVIGDPYRHLFESLRDAVFNADAQESEATNRARIAVRDILNRAKTS